MNKDNCNKFIDILKNSDPKIITLLNKNIVQINCLECNQSGIEGNARAYLIDNPLEVVLCSNRLRNQNEVRETIIHELIHVYDFHNKKYNMFSCDGLASSEIRAAREAECEGYVKYLPQFLSNECVRYHAKQSTVNLFPYGGKKCVNDNLLKAIIDRDPLS
mmetsp:Transcript_8924/g.7965  ORF Transcript_8924/g.7965 Transcript_8924/m.7965 type:complete len:161 (-) Transcript_8924:2-484(-)